MTNITTVGVTNINSDCCRDGKVLVLRRDRQTPLRCIKCNAPAELLPKPYKVSWHHPAYYVLLLLYVWVYFFVALFVQKKAEVKIAVCEKHRAKSRLLIALGWVCGLLGTVIFIVGMSSGSTAVTNIGWPLLIVGIVSAYLARFVSAVGIDGKLVRLRGCGKEFIDSLPEVN